MIENIAHIGFTVSNIDRTIAFYKNILHMHFVGEMKMEGKETDTLFQKNNAAARLAYFTFNEKVKYPLIELIQFENVPTDKKPASFFITSISELCFTVSDIEAFYKHLLDNAVEVLSEPQYLDSEKYGFANSKVFYFKDPDGIILEAVEYQD